MAIFRFNEGVDVSPPTYPSQMFFPWLWWPALGWSLLLPTRPPSWRLPWTPWLESSATPARRGTGSRSTRGSWKCSCSDTSQNSSRWVWLFSPSSRGWMRCTFRDSLHVHHQLLCPATRCIIPIEILNTGKQTLETFVFCVCRHVRFSVVPRVRVSSVGNYIWGFYQLFSVVVQQRYS